MSRARVLFACAVALYLLSLVEVKPAFIAAAASRSLRGGAAGLIPGQSIPTSVPLASRSGLQTASVLLTISACAIAARDATRSIARGGRIQMQGTKSPILVYMTALSEAASKQQQAVQVTKDVMKVKNLFQSEEFMDKVSMLVNEPGLTQLDRADGMIKAMGDMESVVLPKFVTYLAKKKRLLSLKPICEEYVKSTYVNNGVVPVVVTSAAPMSDAQKASVTEKMKIKTGAKDVKLICKVNPDLLGGFTVSWGFDDPQLLLVPTQSEDLSLKTLLAKKAILQGVSPTF